jgi:hypothetical protein
MSSGEETNEVMMMKGGLNQQKKLQKPNLLLDWSASTGCHEEEPVGQVGFGRRGSFPLQFYRLHGS